MFAAIRNAALCEHSNAAKYTIMLISAMTTAITPLCTIPSALENSGMTAITSFIIFHR